jgi:hypothetical protein
MTQVNMKKVEVWLEEKIIGLIRALGGRLQEQTLHHRLNPDVGTVWMRDLSSFTVDTVGWVRLSAHKRQNRLHKVLQRMSREHKIQVRDESGDPTFSEDYTRYIYELGVLDRIAAHLEDDDEPQV